MKFGAPVRVNVVAFRYSTASYQTLLELRGITRLMGIQKKAGTLPPSVSLTLTVSN